MDFADELGALQRKLLQLARIDLAGEGKCQHLEVILPKSEIALCAVIHIHCAWWPDRIRRAAAEARVIGQVSLLKLRRSKLVR